MFLGHQHSGGTVNLDHDVLTTHAAVFGSTGSGKTGLLIGMVEELNKDNIPVILVDIKGDMVNVALQDGDVKVRCLTPGGTHGEAVNVLADITDPTKASATISALLSMIGEDPDPLRSTAHAFLSAVIDDFEIVSLEGMVYGCSNPGFLELGALSLDDAFPKKNRLGLARKLNTLLVSPTFKTWRVGMDLEIDDLIKDKGITVYSVAHLLNSEEQSFAISFLLNELLRWTKSQNGSSALRLVLAIDECVGLLPPVANPPTKEPIMLLLKQARAFGVGLILATQNPVDIDYKAMSNCNTWFVGRMTAERDRDRVVSGMVDAGKGLGGPLAINKLIAGLKPRHFTVVGPDSGATFKSRDVNCDLQGPMVPSEITKMYEEKYITYGWWKNAQNANRARGIVHGVVEAGKTIDEDYLIDEWITSPQDEKGVEIIEEVMNKSELPNVKEAAIGLGILAVAAWSFMQVFDVVATYIKEVL
jgi:hypothetical protein